MTRQATLPAANGPPGDRPAQRRSLDPELQVMAKIDRLMADLDDRATALVYHWFGVKYGPPQLATTATATGGPPQ